MIVWNSQGGRKYPAGTGLVSATTTMRWPSRGTSGAVVTTFQVGQTLTISIGLDIRGGLA
jgi:hypothetical protein